MGEIRLSSEKRLRLFSGRGYPELADDVATELGVELTPTSAYDFSNGEIFVRFEESVRGCDAFVLQSHTAPVNKQIMEQLIMIDALKRASAKRITVVAPFYGYARQDKKHRGREPISARLMALADVYDALVCRRVYKDGMTHAKAAKIIIEGRGKHFDPDVVDAFLAQSAEFQFIASSIADTDEELQKKADFMASTI